MAQIQKYSDELLTQAVEEYAKITPGKIKATELAKWAGENISGLKGVRDYHFTRTVKVKDKKGKTIETSRPSAVMINELNLARSVSAVIEQNPLITSSTIDDFFMLSKGEQRDLILKTREQFEKIKEHNLYLSKENIRIQNENKQIKEKEAALETTLNEMGEQFDRITQLMEQLSSVIDEKNRKAALLEMGITDGDFDFTKFRESMTIKLNEALSISKVTEQKQNNKTVSIINTGMDWDDI